MFVASATVLVLVRAGAGLLPVHRHLGGEVLPATVDWAARGALSPVADENKHGCFGACWAFSAVGAIEAAWFIKTGARLALSEQQMMDCAGAAWGNAGCDGGLMRGAFEYAAGAGVPLCPNATYPYYGPTSTCRASPTSPACAGGLPIGAVAGFRVVADDEQSLMSAVAQQPVSVTVRGAWGDRNAFQNYTGGVLKADCGPGAQHPVTPSGPDHGVLLVGYGVSAEGVPFWKIKNSYGTSWGESGFGRLERGKGVAGGECGIRTANTSSYPVLR